MAREHGRERRIGETVDDDTTAGRHRTEQRLRRLQRGRLAVGEGTVDTDRSGQQTGFPQTVDGVSVVKKAAGRCRRIAGDQEVGVGGRHGDQRVPW
ncbi:MAG: hypothetical protein ACMVO3_18695 [Thalassobaculum sp.]